MTTSKYGLKIRHACMITEELKYDIKIGFTEITIKIISCLLSMPFNLETHVRLKLLLKLPKNEVSECAEN